jgi:hypothetical protein
MEKRATTAGFGPIRIAADVRYIAVNAPRTCTSVGFNAELNYNCQAADVLDQTVVDLLNKYIIPAAVGIVQSTYGVRQTQGNLLLDADLYRVNPTCSFGRVPIPERYVFVVFRSY